MSGKCTRPLRNVGVPERALGFTGFNGVYRVQGWPKGSRHRNSTAKGLARVEAYPDGLRTGSQRLGCSFRDRDDESREAKAGLMKLR